MAPTKFVAPEVKLSKELRTELDDVCNEINERTTELQQLAMRRVRIEMALAAINEPSHVVIGGSHNKTETAKLADGDDDNDDDNDTQRVARIVSSGNKGA